MKRNTLPSEYAEQKAVCDWWRLYARIKGLDERLLFSVPNGAHLAGSSQQRAIKMKMLKATGLRPGVPDLFLAVPKFVPGLEISPQELMFAGLFLELKRKGGRPQSNQVSYCDLLRRRAYNVVVAQGSAEAIRAIKAYVG